MEDYIFIDNIICKFLLLFLDMPITLGEQVNTARKKMGYSLQELATKCGLSTDTIFRLEKNRNSNPTLYVIRQLQKTLKTKFDI